MLRTGQLLSPSQGRRCSASTRGSHPPPGTALPGTPASPRAGLTPAGCHELVARLRRPPPPFLSGARTAGRTWGAKTQVDRSQTRDLQGEPNKRTPQELYSGEQLGNARI